MSLLEKFAQVEIRADAHITEADRIFCQKHQDAYQSALASFQRLLELWRETEVEQRRILSDPERPDKTWSQYLTSSKFPALDVIQIGVHISKLHRKFINAVVSYFNATYHLTVDTGLVVDALIPLPGTEREDDIETEAKADSFDLLLHYEDMIELILSWFDGRSFSEQAPYEMVMKCHRAAWRESDHQPNFEQKKNLVKILNGACCYRCARKEKQMSSSEQWVIDSEAKSILKGLAHFETGSFEEYPYEMDKLLSEESILYEWWDLWEFEDCEKLERIKLFKNGRMDIRFTNEGYARQFVAEYLGTVW